MTYACKTSKLVSLTGPLTLHTMGPCNLVAAFPSKVVKRILSLEFVDTADLRADIWSDDPSSQDKSSQGYCQPVKPPVYDIFMWLECYACMAAVLAVGFPEKAPELWPYHTIIVKVVHTYEGSFLCWVPSN